MTVKYFFCFKIVNSDFFCFVLDYDLYLVLNNYLPDVILYQTNDSDIQIGLK